MTIMTEDGGYIVGIGGSMILYSLYSTVKIKIKNSCLNLRDALLFFRTGECTHKRIKKTLEQLLTIKNELMGINCADAVYNCDNLTETAPWKDNIQTVTSIRAEQTIRPISMAGWFNDSCAVSYLDVSNIDTSRTTDLTCTFYKCGYSNKVFTVVGFEKWDTSNVTQMVGTFCGAGYNATYFTMDGINQWDVSNVKSFEAFLASSGYCSVSWMMDLSGWKPTSATSFNQMFAHAGRMVKERFILTGLETWDVSSVTNFNMCFYYLGHPVDYTLDVSMWNVGTVSKKTNIIAYAGGTILLPAKLK
jgi:hypothetical protein